MSEIEIDPEIKAALDKLSNALPQDQAFTRCIWTIVLAIRSKNLEDGQREDIMIAVLKEYQLFATRRNVFMIAEAFWELEAVVFADFLASLMERVDEEYRKAFERAQTLVQILEP